MDIGSSPLIPPNDVSLGKESIMDYYFNACPKCLTAYKHIVGASGAVKTCQVCGHDELVAAAAPPEISSFESTESLALARLDLIADEVEESWLANDGGLTAAASDVLALVTNAKEAIREGNSSWATWDDMWNCSTGTEQEVIEVVVSYFED